MTPPLHAVVMAGGTGTRLYPASRADRPKQFLSFGGDRSLLARTVDRARFADEVHVVTREAFADRAREHAPGAEVIVEPASKDTGPALVYAAHRLRERVGDGVLLCLPSDHHVDGPFEAVATRMVEAAAETRGLVALGVDPERADPGYGYVKPGDPRDGYAVLETFREKPDPGAAARYVHHGYRWNAGIFAWTPDALLGAARGTDLAALVDALESGDPRRGFAAVDPVSVDHAVMENAENAYLVSAPDDLEWEDLGTWDALERLLGPDEAGNAVDGEALLEDVSGSIVAGGEDAHVTAIGVDDLVIAAYDGRVLVVPKREADRVRDAVAELRGQDRF